MIATAPGKLILTGEYAVLDGSPALVIAVDRRVVARRVPGPRGSAPFLVAVAGALAGRLGADHPAARAALEIAVDSSAFFVDGTKLGLGSSAAVTVAATALALAAAHQRLPVIDRELVAQVAYEAHGAVQRARGATGSGADIAAAVHGGVIAYTGREVQRLGWPAGVMLLPFFTGASADTPELVARFSAARERERTTVDAALAQITSASRAACQACAVRTPEIAGGALIAALALAARATEQLATATGLPLVPPCVAAARAALASMGGTAKTTGAGGGDVAIAVIPATEDRSEALRSIIESGGEPLPLAVDPSGVDLSPDPQ